MAGCAWKDSRFRPHYLVEAEQLRGLTRSEVIAKLGTPMDQRGQHLFWNLTAEHRPFDNSATSALYEFIFVNDRLVDIRVAR